MRPHFKHVAFVFSLAYFLQFAMLCSAQTPVILMPVPKPQYFTQNGVPLAFGCVFTYKVNSTTPLATYVDNTGISQNTNPVILSAAGTASIWIQAGLAYTILVKSSGGTNCASGSTLYTVDGVGGGVTTLTTVVTYSATPVFTIMAESQLFEITLAGDATSQPLTAVGIIPPALVSWEITQDVAGGHAFTWPANSVGGCTIGPGSNQVTLQHFVWDGVNAIATGPCVTANGPTISAGDIFDYGLTAASTVCSDANKKLVSAAGCSAVLSVTYNGQTVAPGGSGNVNSGAGAHSVALNQGDGNAITGLALGAHQIPVGRTSADPTAKTISNCTDTGGQHLNYTQSTDAFSCGTSNSGAGNILASVSTTTCSLAPNGGGEWSCNGTVNWGATLANNTYQAFCSLSCPGGAGSCAGLAGGYQAAFFWTAKSTTQLSYTINDDHSGSNGASYQIDCMAIE